MMALSKPWHGRFLENLVIGSHELAQTDSSMPHVLTLLQGPNTAASLMPSLITSGRSPFFLPYALWGRTPGLTAFVPQGLSLSRLYCSLSMCQSHVLTSPLHPSPRCLLRPDPPGAWSPAPQLCPFKYPFRPHGNCRNSFSAAGAATWPQFP